jgi:hypothetical protein
MKNKKLIISLITLLSIIVILLIILMVLLINKDLNFTISRNVSNNLLIDKTYEESFNKVNITSNSSDIYIKESNESNYKVIVYGKKDSAKVEINNDTLVITSTDKGCIGFCINTIISKIEVYVPENYNNEINIESNYGNITIPKLNNSIINIDSDCGDICIEEVKKLKLKNSYGNITINKVNNASLNSSTGDIKVGTVNNLIAKNDYGNININKVKNYLNIKNDSGDITINNLFINKASSIKNDYGNIKINKTNEIYIDAKTTVGNLNINNNYNKSDITLKIKNDCGDININN